jgi:hypothetical protein
MTAATERLRAATIRLAIWLETGNNSLNMCAGLTIPLMVFFMVLAIGASPYVTGQ